VESFGFRLHETAHHVVLSSDGNDFFIELLKRGAPVEWLPVPGAAPS
jgi:hypothetical protein